MYQVIAPSRLYQQIVEQIDRMIRDGQLKPGDQLPPERELAQRFGVSRTAVREAVKALAEKGLVESQHGRGTFVLDGTQRDFRDAHGRIVRLVSNRMGPVT
jgi:GntR family transcriptional repressor for pyruvate dehydrogenase complex